MSDTITRKKPQIVHLTEDEQAVIKGLQQVRDVQLGMMTDVQFHARYITRDICDLTVWTKLEKDNYTGRTHDIVAVLAVCLRNLKAKLEAVEKNRVASENEEFVMLPPFEAVFAAISASQKDFSNDPKRTVMFLAPQGFGKSALGRAIRRECQPFYETRCRESWARSYSAGVKSVCSAYNIGSVTRSVGELENVMFAELSAGPSVLFYNDFNSAGPKTCNMVRDINDLPTPVVQVITGIPIFMRMLTMRSFAHAVQMKRRCRAIITPMTGRDDDKDDRILPAVWVDRLMGSVVIEGQRAEAIEELTVAANAERYTDFVVAVKRQLLQLGDRALKLKHVRDAIAEANALLNQ